MGFSVVYDRVGRPEAMALACFDDLEVGMAALPEVVEAVKRKEFKGTVGQVVEAFPSDGPRVFVVGLGNKERLTTESFRQAGLALAKKVRASEVESLHFDFPSQANAVAFGQGLGVAFGLTSFSTKTFSGTGSPDQSDVILKIAALNEDLDKGIDRGIKLAKSVNECRRLVNTPPNIAVPAWMATQSEHMAGEVGLNCRVIEGEALEREKLMGLVTVGKASVNKPCLIRLEWRPEGTEGQAPVVLLGKTITYDTGGLSIKSKTGMPGMKFDKSGGCAVFGAMHAVATVLKPDFPVVGLLVAAENSINENAYRPDDVITYRNGVTVEVTNTDAEGRLVLADGLVWAEEVEKAKSVVDMATLTGGVVTALGGVYAGMFTRSDELADELEASGDETGEMLWRLPLHDKYSEMMESKVADIVNSVPGGKAHPVQGATFLSRFISESVEWAHIDIAGVSHSRADDYTDEGPSGFGVRLMLHWLGQQSG